VNLCKLLQGRFEVLDDLRCYDGQRLQILGHFKALAPNTLTGVISLSDTLNIQFVCYSSTYYGSIL
jgi:hypothetical protein